MNNNAIKFRLEKKEDYRAVENLVRESFWNVYRPGCSEHYVIHVLRDDPAFVKELDFVMEENGSIIGQNVFMRNALLYLPSLVLSPPLYIDCHYLFLHSYFSIILPPGFCLSLSILSVFVIKV